MNYDLVKHLTYPRKGSVIVMLLTKNKSVPCTIIKVNRKTSLIQLKGGVETRVDTDLVDTDE